MISQSETRHTACVPRCVFRGHQFVLFPSFSSRLFASSSRYKSPASSGRSGEPSLTTAISTPRRTSIVIPYIPPVLVWLLSQSQNVAPETLSIFL
ncbi:hypothetical protein BDW02DRAFT_378665 [Decorospora gaudefroyi]|uniref:Uncharacterized protein n=1 Tax=Decorospora gaudefroyi TaxID=184978 RepID=A0A6A5KB66_9PLEO|nr:hypothetical protein BDW02DRAFT_378665 [Decorospora gaudefroyi]